MSPSFRTTPCLAAVLVLLSGCGSLGVGPESSMRAIDRVSTFGATPQFDSERYEMVDLISLIDPENLRASIPVGKTLPPSLFRPGVGQEASNAVLEDGDAKARTELARALTAFYRTDPASLASRRNRIQDRLIGASDQRCGAYKVYLNRFDAYQQTGFGWATTLFGGAAGIVGGLKDARILGGLSGISSGMQAELSQGFLGNLASYVIVPGIELRRKAIHEEMMQRRSPSAGEYTLEAALADAARYHGACTLVVGLEQAKEAIQTVENPGLRMMATTLNTVMQTRKMQLTMAKVEAGTDEPKDYVLRGFQLNGVPLGAAHGSAGVRGIGGVPPVPGDPSADLVEAIADLGQRALTTSRNTANSLQAQIAALNQEKEKKTKPELTGKVDELAKALAAAQGNFKPVDDALTAAAITNATKANAALACLGKLRAKLKLATDSQAASATADVDIAQSLISNFYKPWVDGKTQAVEAWRVQLAKALSAAQYEAIASQKPADIAPSSLAQAVQSAVDNGKTLLNELPTPNFAERKLDCP